MTPERRKALVAEIAEAWEKSQPIGEVPSQTFVGSPEFLAWLEGRILLAERPDPKPWADDLLPVRTRLSEAMAELGADEMTIGNVLDVVIVGQSRETLVALSKKPDPNGSWFRKAAEGLLRANQTPQYAPIQRAKEFGP